MFASTYMPIADTTGDFVADWQCFFDLDIEQHQELDTVECCDNINFDISTDCACDFVWDWGGKNKSES